MIIHLTRVEFKRRYGIAELIEDGTMLSYFHLHLEESQELTSISSLLKDAGKEKEMDAARAEKKFTRQYLHSQWVKRFDKQPISAIREYLGEKVALYFAYCGLYTNWLIFPSVAGLIVTVFGFARLAAYVNLFSYFRSGNGVTSANWYLVYDNALMPVYCIFLNLWSSSFLDFWKRRNNFLALKWGVLDNKLAEPTRRQFTPTSQTPSLVTGTMVPYYPTWKRVLRQSVTIIAILSMLALVVLTIFGQVVFQSLYLPQEDDVVTNSIVLTISGYVFTKLLMTIFKPVAERLSEWENYELESVHLDARNLKVYSFIFVNVFSVCNGILMALASLLPDLCPAFFLSKRHSQMRS